MNMDILLRNPFLELPFDGWISTGMAIDHFPSCDERSRFLLLAVSASKSLALARAYSDDGGTFWRYDKPNISSLERWEVYRRPNHQGRAEANELVDCLVSWQREPQ